MRKVIYEEAMDGITISRLIRNYEFNMPSKHTHDEYEIYYLVRGERSYFIEKQIYHIKQGCLVFINRNTIHMTTQYKDSYHERIVLEMREEPIASLLACTGELQLSDFFQRNQGVIELDAENQQYIMSLLDGIASEMGTKDPGYKMMAMNKLIRLFFFTVRHLKQSDFSASTTSLSTTATHQKVTEVASYISANFAQAESLDYVAKRFFMSKSYLSRIFKEITGYTVNEYINVNRIQQARKLLAESDLNITEIAETLGYDSITYFEKIFRKHTETSPLKYRKQCLKEKESPAVRPKTYQGEQLQ